MRILGCLSLVLALLGFVPGQPALAAAPPTRSVAVTGDGESMYPAFSPTVERYGVLTTAAASAGNGSVSVKATTTDPAGTVLVDGRPPTNGAVTVTGLSAGDEISVIIKDSGGTEVHALVYLPPGFPHLTTVVDQPGTTDGDVLLTLSMWVTAAPSYEVAVDRNGVPSFLEVLDSTSLDLKPAPGGHYSVGRRTTAPGRTGQQIVELDGQFQPVRSHETSGLVDTDAHDAILKPDGGVILMAYEANATSGLTDAVIQELEPGGDVSYTWNSADHMNPATETTNVPGRADYAHINSIQLMDDGDILASFRHTSSVMKIAWSAHDGFRRGDVVWRLGGRFSDFTFVADPYPSGPCAQHTAQQLANGHILIFDNGSAALNPDPSFCVDDGDPTGPTVNRAQTRVTEYALDETTGTATLVWSYSVPGRFALFAGSVRRLPGGNTLIGWAAAQDATATEVNPAGQVLWESRNTDGYFTYRAVKAVVPDEIKPVVRVDSPAQGASYAHGQRVAPVVACTDQGGSTLQSCTASRGALDTSTAGRHTYTVVATDGDGNTTTVTRSYTVGPVPASRPDANIRTTGGGWVGNNVFGGPTRQQVAQQLRRRGARGTSIVRVQNEGNRADRIVVHGTGGTRRFGVRYFLRGTEVTRQVRAGTLRVSLVRGGYVDLGVVVQRLRRAKVRTTVRVLVTASSGFATRQPDTVGLTVRATR
jgi:hypothetical protein